MKSISGAGAVGTVLIVFPQNPGSLGGARRIFPAASQYSVNAYLAGGQSEFACDCACSKIYCLDLELQRTVVSPHVSSTVVSPQVGQITNTLIPVPRWYRRYQY